MSSGRAIEKVIAGPSDLLQFTKIVEESFPNGKEYNGPLEKYEYNLDGSEWMRKQTNVSFAQSLPMGRVKEVVRLLHDSGSRSFEHVNNPATEALLKNETIAATLDIRSTHKFN